MPKWSIVLIAVLAGLIGLALGIFISDSQKVSPMDQSKKNFSYEECFFELPREEIIAKIESINYRVDDSEVGGYKLWNREDYTVFHVTDEIQIGLNWLEPDYQRLKAISIIRPSVDHTDENAKPILDIWSKIEPEMVPLFKNLIKDHLSVMGGQWFRNTDARRYQNSNYTYGVAMNNKYWVEYKMPDDTSYRN